jgi:hypothetical protein
LRLNCPAPGGHRAVQLAVHFRGTAMKTLHQ